MSTLFAFFLILIPLVVVHELGHFLAAKFFGIKVHQFAFGFGKKLFSFEYGGTDYRFNLLPFGGYVDFMGESLYTHVAPEDDHHFLNRSKWQRFVVLLMGPVFNFLMAYVLLVVYEHQPGYQAIPFGEHFTVGYVEPESPEYVAGLRPGDEILKVNGHELADDTALFHELALKPNQEAQLEIQRDGSVSEIKYAIGTDEVEGIGLIHFAQAIRIQVRNVVDDSPAARAGVQVGDIVTAVNGQKVFFHRLDEENIVSTLVNQSASPAVLMSLERNGRAIEASVYPELNEAGKRLLGINLGLESELIQRSWVQAGAAAWDRSLFFSTLIFRTIRGLVQGELSVKTMSGPWGVGRIAKEELDRGIIQFLFLMAVLSLNLGIANLLPIPVLDGGEILVIAVEWVSRRDFTFDTKLKVKMAGFVFLVGLMGTVLLSDVIKDLKRHKLESTEQLMQSPE